MADSLPLLLLPRLTNPPKPPENPPVKGSMQISPDPGARGALREYLEGVSLEAVEMTFQAFGLRLVQPAERLRACVQRHLPEVSVLVTDDDSPKSFYESDRESLDHIYDLIWCITGVDVFSREVRKRGWKSALFGDKTSIPLESITLKRRHMKALAEVLRDLKDGGWWDDEEVAWRAHLLPDGIPMDFYGMPKLMENLERLDSRGGS